MIDRIMTIPLHQHTQQNGRILHHYHRTPFLQKEKAALLK